ncbi:tyrosine-type recombinase/integrase [Tautonia plasticadhaerens]|uniref:Site-specific tyrosine recombinase XerC n=1 Tax=Tautonia plasticadhaerens TaxID=2527974 RepID=A0A518H2C7_9BACT|nr:tyrosine-type recombinase/integrase [Tautonia plasticadhaerens]QDV35006.1 site-specific tyrosine recombinase XerC [Tautonia plasticadhaerens]
MNKPWFRSDRLSWFVELPGGKQVNLGRDERFTSPPKVKPKEPPPAIQKKYLAAMQAQAEPEDRKLSFCTSKYLESLQDCRPNSIRRAKDYLESFARATGDPKVSRLRAHHVTDFLKGKPWAPNSVRQFIITVNACLNYCARQDWIAANPIKGKVTMPLARRREDVMSPEDAERLAAAAAPEFRDVLHFLAGTGCRPIEAREALIEKCDFDKGVLMVPNKTKAKTGIDERPVFLSTAMIELLKRVIGDRKAGHIFSNKFGKPWQADALRVRMRRLCDKLGITYGDRMYSHRHAWASTAINEKGLNPALVAIQLGHTDLKQLMKTYLHHDHKAMREALDGNEKREG